VRRSRLLELHFIARHENLQSIAEQGILCRRLAQALSPRSVANEEILEIRRRKRVPGPEGLSLLDYVNLYICGRNPMLFSLQAQNENLCVLRVSPTVLDLPGVVITDMNAARTFARFAPSPEGLGMVDETMVFARYWAGGTLDDDPIQKDLRTGAKCAEVLVPHRVEPGYLLGGRVCSDASKARVLSLVPTMDVIVDSDLFFDR
jgi:hypothetical protein